MKKMSYNSVYRKYINIFNINQIRFELINLKIFKKLFRKRYIKKKMRFIITKYWVIVRPNFILTMKSKNSRMGSGVGNYIRICSIIKPNTTIIMTKNYSINILKKIIKYVKKKMNVNLNISYRVK
jgi:ribosomal protein L16/L10AE